MSLAASGCESSAIQETGLGTPAQSGAPSFAGDHEMQLRVVDYGMNDNAYCLPVRDWDEELMAFERRVLELSNEARAQGLDCGSRGTFPAAQPLKLNSQLTCAARAHSVYMAQNDVFDHIGPDGQNPGDRIALTEYPVTAWGENIAYGFPTPESVVEGWKNSEGHCANLMRSYYTQMGVGVFSGGNRGIHWTQVMGTGEDQPFRGDPPELPAPVFGAMGALLLGLGLGRAVRGASRNP